MGAPKPCCVMKLAICAGRPANGPSAAADAAALPPCTAMPLLGCAMAPAADKAAASSCRGCCCALRSAARRFCLRAWRRLSTSGGAADGDIRSTAVLSFSPFSFAVRTVIISDMQVITRGRCPQIQERGCSELPHLEQHYMQ